MFDGKDVLASFADYKRRLRLRSVRKYFVGIDIVTFTTAIQSDAAYSSCRVRPEEMDITMKVCLPEEQDNVRTPMKFVPVQLLQQRNAEIHNMLARRAYELFECHGRVSNHEIDDWMQAESELIFPCRHDLEESEEDIILHIDLPGSLTADQLTVSVEPRRLLVSSEKEISELFGDASDAHWEVRWQQIFRVHHLPADVNPSKATATLNSHAVEIVLSKASLANERCKKALSTS